MVGNWFFFFSFSLIKVSQVHVPAGRSETEIKYSVGLNAAKSSTHLYWTARPGADLQTRVWLMHSRSHRCMSLQVGQRLRSSTVWATTPMESSQDWTARPGADAQKHLWLII